MMTDKEIVERYLLIPKEERERLQVAIEMTRREFRQTTILNYIRIMTEILGGNLILFSRKEDQVNARAVLSYVLHEHNFSEPEIGRALCKDHSMIHNYISQTKFYLSQGVNNSRIRLLNEYKNILKQYEI